MSTTIHPPCSITKKCEEILGTPALAFNPIIGGDISQAWQVSTDKDLFFLKYNPASVAAEMFQTEAKGLGLLDATSTIRIPQVVACESNFLLLEFIEIGNRPVPFWENFGHSLAAMHKHSSPQFGLDHSNFIGSLPQSNNLHPNWSDFYINERLQPQFRLAFDAGLLQKTDLILLEKLYKELTSICPNEPPALIHGDLWSGNFLTDKNGAPVLIDPSVCYAHREMDLAMSRLFGGFERAFYRSYESAFPLEPGFEKRLPVYQLYYLLAHVNLFGGGYLRSVRNILKSF